MCGDCKYNMNEFIADQIRSKAITDDEKKFVEQAIKQMYDVDEKLKALCGHTDPVNSYETMIAKFDLYPEAIEKLFENNSIPDIKRIMVTLLHFIGLSGEVGELGEKLKKSVRDESKLDLRDTAIAKEMGDCAWYLFRLASDFGYPMNEILRMNYGKLSKRLEKDKLHGSGDDREEYEERES